MKEIADWFARLCAASLCCALAATPVNAQNTQNVPEGSATLQKIKQKGVMAVGYFESNLPFSYLDEKRMVVGYSYDIAGKIAADIAKAINLPAITIKPIQITGSTRFSLLQNGVIDIECSTTTNNIERQKLFAFSNNFFITGTRLMTKKSSGINDFPDLSGKTVVVGASTTSEELLRKFNTEKKARINIISAHLRDAAPLSVLQGGQADALMADDALLYGAISESWRPDDWTVTGKPLSHEAYACMMRKNDPQFKKLVDAAIAKMMLSGVAADLYGKWFLSPIPPKGMNLRFPLSEAMRHLFNNPNDKPLN